MSIDKGKKVVQAKNVGAMLAHPPTQILIRRIVS